MDIVKAELCDAELVKQLSHDTIKAVYPHYYPRGAVDFFLAHHSMDHIIKDIEEGNVWLIYSDGKAVGTVTLNGNEINRLFVLPKCQEKASGVNLCCSQRRPYSAVMIPQSSVLHCLQKPCT